MTSDRRDFILQLAAIVAAASREMSHATPLGAALSDSQTATPQDLASSVVGMQVGPHTMLDEGIEHSLDLIQRTAGVSTIFVYCHSYGGDLRKPLDYLAKDHGRPVLDQRTRNLPNVWVRQHEQYFKDTTLRHPAVDATFTYHDRDLFAEMIKPLRQRGMKVYPRILEAGGRGIVNFSTVATINVYGKPTGTGCWNHPEYIGFWRATVEDLFRSYDADGFQWGAERASPLANILQNGNDTSATCFCQHCRARGKAAGVDPDRAREGMEHVLKLVQGLRANQLQLADGAAAGFLRLLLRYPEVLAWDYQYRLSREAVMKTMYDQIKRIKPAAPVGWHVDHWATSMDIIARSAMSYAEMAPWSDYLKVVMYHAVTGPRTRTWVTNVQRSVLSELTVEEALDLHDDLFGYDKTLRPKPNAPASPNTWPDYVYRETKRSVASAEGKTKIYPGIGFNVPGAGDDPDTINRVVLKAYEAGANGVVASREYEEMTVPNLEAFGRGVREALKK